LNLSACTQLFVHDNDFQYSYWNDALILSCERSMYPIMHGITGYKMVHIHDNAIVISPCVSNYWEHCTPNW